MYATGCPLTRRHDAPEGYMPEKDPSIWAWLCAWAYQNAPTIYSFCLAFAIAAIRVLYGGGTKRTMILEGALCGALSLSFVSGMKWFGIPVDAAAFIGGMVGFIGVKQLQIFALRIINKHVPKEQ
ncbi:phage holin, lambda family [Plesiomonas shigelloides subsp. oncorhynchi]|nr:phage holin, lambda family [Plesiomonas shigelloides]